MHEPEPKQTSEIFRWNEITDSKWSNEGKKYKQEKESHQLEIWKKKKKRFKTICAVERGRWTEMNNEGPFYIVIIIEN